MSFNRTQDHFNWPFPQRNETIANSGKNLMDITGPIQPKPTRERASTSLMTSDISHAKPYIRGYEYTNKQSFLNKTDDININDPSKLAKTSNLLKVDDIEGARPNKVKFVTKRSTNPLNPIYNLASFKNAPPPEQRFIRDQMNVKDIEGTHPDTFFLKYKDKKIVEKPEIFGTKYQQRKIPNDQIDTLNVRDINRDGIKTFIRNTNPLDPRYFVQTDENKPQLYGEIPEARSIIRHQEKNKPIMDPSLTNRDIDGAWSNSLKERLLLLNTRKEFHQVNKCDDIQGTKTGTLVKGIRTNRISNPLQPQYNNPGHTEAESFYPNKNADILTKFQSDNSRRSGRSQSQYNASKAQKFDSFVQK